MVGGREDQARGRVRAVVRRALVLAALVAAGVVTGRVVTLLLDDHAPTAAPSGPPTVAATPAPGRAPGERTEAGAPLRRATAVLHGWDADRARAYARGDPAALRRLYTPGSRAGVRDRRVLEAYVERGLVVQGLRTQVLELRVLTGGRGRLTVEVTDRLVGGWAVAGPGTRSVGVPLPRDGPSTRVLVLRQQAGDWRVRSVRAG